MIINHTAFHCYLLLLIAPLIVLDKFYRSPSHLVTELGMHTVNLSTPEAEV